MMLAPDNGKDPPSVPATWIATRLPELTAALATLARRLLRGRVADGKDPEDLVQDAILKAVERPDLFKADAPEDLQRWLVTVLRHNAINLLRREGRFQQARQILARPVLDGADVTAEHRRRDESLPDVFLPLNSSDRELIALRYLAGLNWTDLGTRVGLSAEAARKRVSRAFARLHRSMSVRDSGAGTERAFSTAR